MLSALTALSSSSSLLSSSLVAIPCAATPSIDFPPKQLSSTPSWRKRFAPIRSSNNPSVDYSSTVSVFPAEACETVGGDACLADMYPEAKLKPEEAKTSASNSKEEAVEREYLDYTDSKTVLMDEACDVLGGEFCEPPYQKQQQQQFS